MVTPIPKPVGPSLIDEAKTLRTLVNNVRFLVEQAIANLKTWRVSHIDYRRPLRTFTETISAVVGRYFFTTSELGPGMPCWFLAKSSASCVSITLDEEWSNEYIPSLPRISHNGLVG
ncbi:hypothetical protein [Brevibacterium antiquum]|uniref:hypothetical protein n=1 Tax=Brevibacterium antiquum TaxID=234835 RepID=UPI0018E01265|nr:hypothetical protein [Brevibacterium antiquum]